MPFYGYARQDKKHRGREPISARLIADMMKTDKCRARLLTVDLHTDQIQGFFDGPVDHIFALPLLADYVGRKVDRNKLTVVSPDAGRVRVADRWCDRWARRWRSCTSAGTRTSRTRSPSTRSWVKGRRSS
ncbi:Putative ribose-phosphate pyrophosphokinase [Streptomyces violarus]